MRVTVAECSHGLISITGSPDHGTCGECYHRLRNLDAGSRRGMWVEDLPAVPCEQHTLRPISEAVTRRLPYQDALCTTCGRVLRHPDGPGSWEEVFFYGLIIDEEP